MRKRFFLTNPICRLLTLLLILPWCVVDASENFKFDSSDFDSIQRNPENANAGDVISSTSYRYKVWNACTKRYLRIWKPGRKGVDAKGDQNGNYTTIILDAIGLNGEVRIKGEESGLYLCFSKRGKLRVKHRHSDYCKFNRIVNKNLYDEFKLTVNRNWYIGFSKRRKRTRKGLGKPLPGYYHIKPKMRKCYQFYLKPLDDPPPRPKPPVNWNDPNLLNFDPEGQWIRRTKVYKPRIPHRHRHGHGTKKRRRKNRNGVNR